MSTPGITQRMEATLGDGPTGLSPLVHVVLVEPQIPANTGNIARTCAATGSALHLVGTLGYSLQDADVRRAGLDYWPSVDLHWHPDLDALRTVMDPGAPWFLFTARTVRGLYDCAVPRGSVLVFGREDTGLPEPLLEARAPDCVRLPMRGSVRSLNLSNAVAVAVFESARQLAMNGG